MLRKHNIKLDEINNKIISITEDILESNISILNGLEECEKITVDKGKEKLKNINSRIIDIDNSIVKVLALYYPEAKDLRLTVSLFKITNELLRASSNTRIFITGLGNYCSELEELTIKEFAVPMQKSTIDCLMTIIKMMKTSSNDETLEYFNKLVISENKTDEYYELLQDNIYKKAPNIEDFRKFTKILKTFRKSEKIAGRMMDIGALLVFARIGGELGTTDI